MKSIANESTVRSGEKEEADKQQEHEALGGTTAAVMTHSDH